AVCQFWRCTAGSTTAPVLTPWLRCCRVLMLLRLIWPDTDKAPIVQAPLLTIFGMTLRRFSRSRINWVGRGLAYWVIPAVQLLRCWRQVLFLSESPISA